MICILRSEKKLPLGVENIRLNAGSRLQKCQFVSGLSIAPKLCCGVEDLFSLRVSLSYLACHHIFERRVGHLGLIRQLVKAVDSRRKSAGNFEVFCRVECVSQC